MLSIVIIIFILLIDHTYQFETIQAALSSTVELPCSIGQNLDATTNPAKVCAGRDKCLYI